MTSRLRWIDYAKGIGMLCVIVGHIGISHFGAVLYSFHLPLFFFIAGYTYNSSHESINTFLIKKSKRMLIPYFGLGAIVIVFYMLRRFFLYGDRDINVYFDYLVKLIFQIRYLSIWFIAALFLSMLLFFLIDKLLKNNYRNLIVVSFLIGMMGFAYAFYGGEPLFWNFDIAVQALLFISIGYAFKCYCLIDHIEKFTATKKAITVIVTGISTVCFSMLNYKVTGQQFDLFQGTVGNYILESIAALSGIICVISISMIFSNYFIEFIGRESIVFLALHQSIFTNGMIELSDKYGILATDTFSVRIIRLCIVLIFTLIGCSLIDLTLNKTRMKILIGK